MGRKSGLKRDVPLWITITVTIATAITCIATVITCLHPWIVEKPKTPEADVYFVREKCAIVPTNSNFVLVKLVIRNKGQTEESNLKLRVLPLSGHWIVKNATFMNTTETITLAAGDAAVHVIPVEYPGFEVIPQPGYIKVQATVVGTQKWDEYIFSESW